MRASVSADQFFREFVLRDPNHHGSRAADYFWNRKRRLALQLFAAHRRDVEATSTTARRIVFADIGCGDGCDLALIASFTRAIQDSQPDAARWRFVGVDGFPECLERARARMHRLGLSDVEVVTANIVRGFGMADSEVDFLYCSEVLEHIPNLDPFLAEIHRVVRPGGLALITTPNQPNIFQRSYWSASHRRKVLAAKSDVYHHAVEINGENVDIYGHVSLHTASEWDALFQRQGFDRVDFRRGAATYGGVGLLNRTPIHEIRLVFEQALDCLPRAWSRELSDGVIAVYRKRPGPGSAA